MDATYFMGIDTGTNSSKGVIIDEDCNVAVSYTHLTLPTIA